MNGGNRMVYYECEYLYAGVIVVEICWWIHCFQSIHYVTVLLSYKMRARHRCVRPIHRVFAKVLGRLTQLELTKSHSQTIRCRLRTAESQIPVLKRIEAMVCMLATCICRCVSVCEQQAEDWTYIFVLVDTAGRPSSMQRIWYLVARQIAVIAVHILFCFYCQFVMQVTTQRTIQVFYQ